MTSLAVTNLALVYVVHALPVAALTFARAVGAAPAKNTSSNIARTHAHVEIAHFPTKCIIMAWEAGVHRPSPFQVLMMHLVVKCALFARAWDLAFIS